MDAHQVLDEMPPAAQIDDLDDVLPIIVSFLPAHEAVRTCVLAKRWRNVWKSAPALRITAVKGFGRAKFDQFVDRLIFLRREAPSPLDVCEFDLVESEFDFDWTLSAQHVYFNSVQPALNCQVQFLSCRFTPTDPRDFAEDFPEPAAPLLSQHVQRLELCYIRAALDFSGCPALLRIKMDDCVIRAANMVSDSLQHLSMNRCQLYMQQRTSMSLPNLVCLEMIDCFGRLPVLENLLSLEAAIVRLGESPEDRCSRSNAGCLPNDDPCPECRFTFEFDAERGRSYFFHGLSRATHLELSACFDHAFIFQRDLKWRPTFPMLKTLVLDDWCLDADLSGVIFFIQHSPKLEKLTLDLFEELDSLMVAEVINQPLGGASVTDHFKMVEINCEKADGRINKILNILGTCGVSLDKIYIRQTDANLGAESDRRRRRRLDHLDKCTLCDQVLESIDHLLIQCPFTRDFWFNFCHDKGVQDIVPLQHETLRGWWLSLSNRCPQSQRKDVAAIAIAGMWRIWLERNARTFERESKTMAQLLSLANEELQLWRTAKLRTRRRGVAEITPAGDHEE